MLPTNYEEWKDCIEVECGIPLTEDFICTRIRALSNLADAETKKFINLYGMSYYNLLIGWFRHAEQSLLKSA